MNFSSTLCSRWLNTSTIVFVICFTLNLTQFVYALGNSVIVESGDKPFSISSIARDNGQVSYNAAPITKESIKPLPAARIVILKEKRELLLYDGDELYRSYLMGLGFAPDGDKEIQGDGKTPIGSFRIRVKNEQSAFYLSLGLDYPNLEDATRGFMDDLIDFQQYVEIITAINDHKMPPQETNLGGNIYIHGNGSDDDWTKGCIALENRDIEELFALVATGTPVTIKP